MQLRRRIGSLTAERDNYLSGLTQQSQNLAAAKRELKVAEARHVQERKDDTLLFQDNLKRLLAEKSKLIDEAELVSGQKDALTEALVKANFQLSNFARIDEELRLFKVQHAEGAEQQQQAFASRDAAMSNAAEVRRERDKLQEQLAAMSSAMQATASGVDRLRTELEGAKSMGDASRLSHLRAESRAARLDASVRSLVTELSGLDESHASTTAQLAASRDRADAERVCYAATLAADDATISDLTQRTRTIGAEADHSVAASSAARDDAARLADESASALVASEAQVATLTAERDAATGELAAQKRVADSLRQELKKAMQKATRAATESSG